MKSPVFQKIARLLLGAVLLLCLVPASVSAADFAASVTVGETVTPCVTLQEAITAAQSAPGSTVTVLQNVTVDNTIVISSGTFTLDLNGQVIKDTLDNTGLPVFQVAAGASLTVTDNSSSQTGAIGQLSEDQYANNNPGIENAGTFTLTSGTIIGEPGILNTGTAYLQGGFARASRVGAAGDENSGIWSTAGNVYVSAPAHVGNRLESDNSTVVISGGDIESISVQSGSLEMTGGDIAKNKWAHWGLFAFDSTIRVSNVKIDNSFIALTLINCDTIVSNTSITGGYIINENCVAVSGGSLTFKGCTFTRKDTSKNVFTVSDGADVTVYDATFTNGVKVSGATLNSILADTYIYFDKDSNVVVPGSTDTVTADNETYTVKHHVVATVTTDGGTTEYPVLSWAVAAAEATPGSILKLQMDQALTAELPINTGGFTFDLNGHSLSAPQNALNIGAGASLILTDSGDTKGSAGTVASAGSVTLRGDVNLTSQQAELILKNNARLYLDGLTGTDTYTVELLDASGAFATGEFGSRADGSTVDAATAARFTSIQDPYYVVQVNADGCLEVAPATVELTAEIVWIDGNDADGVRPDSVTVTVSLDGATAATQSVSSGKHTFILPKYDGTRSFLTACPPPM